MKSGHGWADDADALRVFRRGGAEAASAFEWLVARHGNMVHRTCLRVLGRCEDAEDAAQAVFLVLARKGRPDAGSVAAFLHRVALNVSRRALVSAGARRAREKEAARMALESAATTGDSDSVAWEELRRHLDEAMDRLPAAQRSALVLHYLEGKSHSEVAGELGLREGTVASRLNRATEKLRRALHKRGVSLGVAALAAALARNMEVARCPEFLLSAAGRIAAAEATAGAAALAANVLLMAKGAMKAMLWTKFKIAAAVLVLAGAASALLPLTRSRPVAHAGEPKPPGGDPFGYSQRFDEELKRIGQITPAKFRKMYPAGAAYLPKIKWNPTTARHWGGFNADPKKTKKRGGYDFRLNPKELAVFRKNGFVVSERMGSASFAEMFYRVYSRDLPVFVSTDSLLHAWHRSYDAILEELEETYLSRSLDEILGSMADGLPAARTEYGKGVLSQGLRDADYFIAVGRSLLAGSQVRCRLGGDGDVRAARTLEAVKAERLQKFKLFGKDRKMDFSQFKPRGHYEHSELLRRYFKAMMWCGRIDMRVASKNPDISSARQLASAVVLHDLLKRSGKFEQWRQFDRMIQTFVGWTDSMTFAQLGAVLGKGGVKSPRDVENLDVLVRLQKRIMAGKLGAQHIRSHYVESSPFGADKAELPRSFTVLGQKFVVDSWVTAKVVADDVLWNESKVQRRIPSCLDVAFAALGNDQVVSLLHGRMTAKDGRAFRDGLNYQHNLAAARNVIDSQDKNVWDRNLYLNWLGCLRELSRPSTDEKYPQVMRTEAWAMKTLNTQMASWSQLRHDTILYVKQSYTAGVTCEYPAGYVEPRVAFWKRFEKMANLAGKLLRNTPYPDRVVTKKINKWRTVKIKLRDLQRKHAGFFKAFGERLAILRAIAEKQLAGKELDAAETKCLRDIVQIHRGSGFTRYNGWYPGLFYKGRTDSGKWDAIVADVHTNVPAPPLGDPGCVLHQGVGNVDYMLMAVERGGEKMLFAGPTLSHYEFEMLGVKRKADSEWRKDINAGKLPPRPEWTRSYVVPGLNKRAKYYRWKR